MSNTSKSNGLGPASALMVLALIFLLSVSVRAVDGVTAAIAQDAGEEPPVSEPLAPEPPPDLAAALAEIRLREQDADRREAELAARAAELAEIEDRLRSELARLAAAEERLARTIQQTDGAAEADLARLTAVYENMKPKQAALLFAEMDPDFAAGFLGRMRPDAAAEVLAGLDPTTAYQISVLLAGRNAAAPVE